MKISVVTDGAGKILGFSHAAPARASSRVDTAIESAAGQTVYEVELSPELAQRAHDDDFADAIFAHVLVKKGRAATLVRSVTSPATRTKRKE